MALMDRKKLLAKRELKVEKVDLGGGEFVYVRQMTGRERDRWEISLMKEDVDKEGNTVMKQSLEDFRAKLAVNTICDEQGNLLLKPEDVDALSQNMTGAELLKIASAAQELNKITEADKEKLVKN